MPEIDNYRSEIDEIFRKSARKIYVYLPGATVKGPDFDPFRQKGYETKTQPPFPVWAIIRDISPEKMVLKEFGIDDMDGKEILIQGRDINLIKLSLRIVIDGNDYFKFHDSVGKKFMIWKRASGYYRVWVFQRTV